LVYPLNFTYLVSANVNADAVNGQNCGIDQRARRAERCSAEYKIVGEVCVCEAAGIENVANLEGFPI
jgi:hypothetical protein